MKKQSEKKAGCDGSIMNESLGTLNFSEADADSVLEWELCGQPEKANIVSHNVGVVSNSSSRNVSPLNMQIYVNPDISFSDQVISTPVQLVPDHDVCAEDVLLGRGRKHPGNDHFRELVNGYFDEFEASKKHRQTEITKEVVETIMGYGGRFLEKPLTKSSSKDEKTWAEIEFQKARLKVAHTFRSVRKQRKKKKAKEAANMK